MKNTKNVNHKKIIVASALMAGAAIGGTTLATSQMVNATSDTSSETQTSEQNKRPELSEQKKAEIKAKLEAMTEEEKQEWLANHKPKNVKNSEQEESIDNSNQATPAE